MGASELRETANFSPDAATSFSSGRRITGIDPVERMPVTFSRGGLM